MLSRNQLKVGGDGRDDDRGEFGAEVLLLESKEFLFLREREDTRVPSKRLMDNKTGEHTVGRGHIYTRQLDKSGGQGRWHRQRERRSEQGWRLVNG